MKKIQRERDDQLMYTNELDTNILSLKIIFAIIVGGFGLLAILVALEIINITFREWSFMSLMTLGILGLEVILWHLFKEKPFLKFLLVFFNGFIFFFLFYTNEISLAMSPFWLVPVAISVLYFSLPLSVFAGFICTIGNGFFIFTDPGRGMEMLDSSAMATNSLIFLITSIALIFISYKGRNLLSRLGEYEKEAREQTVLLENIIMESKEMAERTSSLSDSLNQSALGLNRSFEEIAHSTMEASQGAEDLNQKGISLSSFSQEVSKDIGAGQRDLNTISGKMDLMEKSIQGFSGSFLGLKDKVKRLETIVISIEKIAGETNMLALNAAIEAARAGDYGRQFSVVAEEVRKLANEATNSSKEMEKIVQAIQEQLEETHQVMLESTDEIRGGIGDLKKTQEVVGKVLPSAKESYGEIIGITGSLQDLSSTIETIAAASQEQTAEVEEIHASVELLRDCANQLLSSLQGLQH